jgi:hypothetical protein
MEMEARVTVTVIRLSGRGTGAGSWWCSSGSGCWMSTWSSLGGRCRPNTVLAVAYDLGLIGDRTFVNNASFGVHAEVVQSPAYRDDKAGTVLQMLPDMLGGHEGAHLVVGSAGM